MLAKIEKEELDYDPFLNAQDCDMQWLNTLAIRKGSIENVYIVSYIDGFNHQKVLVKIKVIEEKNKLMIDSIW